MAMSLNNLGLVYMRLGRYAEAEPTLKRALAIREKVLPKDHPDIGQSLGNLAADYRYAGRAADGLPLIAARPGDHMEKNFGTDQLNVTYSLTATANAYVALHRYAEGEPFARRSLAVRQKALGPDHIDVASVLKTLAQIDLGTNRVLPALDFSRQAAQVAIRALKNGDVATLLRGPRELRDVSMYTSAPSIVPSATALPEARPSRKRLKWRNGQTSRPLRPRSIRWRRARALGTTLWRSSSASNRMRRRSYARSTKAC